MHIYDESYQGDDVLRVPYQNYHANIPAKEVALFSPRTAAQVSAALQYCIDRHRPLLTIGRRFSLSRLVEAYDTVLDPQKLRIIQRLPDSCLANPDANRAYYLVGGGTALTDLNHRLGQDGWALPTSGAASNQSLVGAASTGTHGASTYGAVHDCIRAALVFTEPGAPILLQAGGAFTDELRVLLRSLVDGDVRLPAAVDADDAFGAAVVGLGAVGLVFAVVVEVEPLYQLVGAWRDSIYDDDKLWRAIEKDDFAPVIKAPADAPPSAAPFNIAVTFSPYARGQASIHGAFASFLWKIPPREAYPPNFPESHPRLSSALERWAASISPYLPSGVVAWIIHQHYHDGEWDPRKPAFPGFVFGPTTIPAGNGRSTEITVPVAYAGEALRCLLDTLWTSPNRVVGLVGLRYVGGTKSALLGMNQGRVACMELPCLNDHPEDNQRTFELIWNAIDRLGCPYTFHWGQEGKFSNPALSRYFGAKLVRWQAARHKLLSPASRQVFRNPLTDSIGLTP